ncbi:MAG: TM0996/MTH895 family glutaredoxin-like protein, partial [Mailhella sp.]|nr:TM0996/MTH895 family glutaredoxin-like protein [Mailhella sp.]
MVIKVYGPGCGRCKETESVMRDAAQTAGCAADIQKVSDLKEMMATGVLATPAVVIDGKMVCSGRIPSKEEAVSWLTS